LFIVIIQSKQNILWKITIEAIVIVMITVLHPMKETTVIIGTERATVPMTGADIIQKTGIHNTAQEKEDIRPEEIR